MRQKYFLALGAVSAVAVAAYFGTKLYLASQVEAKRMRKQRSLNLPDGYGNYDIDGVSFDHSSDEVIVSGDRAHTEASKPSLLH